MSPRRFHLLTPIVCAAMALPALAQDVTRPGDTITPSSPNHPVGEPAPAAIDNTAASKYLNFDRLNTGFTVTPSGTGIVRVLNLITANDAPERDPVSFLLEGSDDGTLFTMIAQGNLTAPTSRFSLYSASFANAVSYRDYRVTFPTIRAGSANSMQIAEVQLATLADITSPTDTVSVTYTPGASSNPNEGVANAFDNRLDRKFDVLMGILGPTTIDLMPAVGSTIVSGLLVYGANDDVGFPGRTPVSITLSGSNDGTTYTPIFTTPLVGNTSNFQDQQFSFSNTTGFTRYRIELGASEFADDMQIGEIELLGIVGAGTPANDECANAALLAAGTISATTTNASGTDITPCGAGDSADVWFRYNASASRLVEVNTCGPSGLDTTLAVYRSCGGVLVACDDNSCRRHAIVRFQAVGGQSYFVRVAAAAGSTGGFTLTLNEAPEVHNDIAIELAHNFNGMVHPGESGNPDAPDGYRSISDRGIDLNGGVNSLDTGLLGLTRLPYRLVGDPDVVDIVHIGNRTTVDFGFRPFDDVDDEDDFGLQPAWLPDPAQEGPHATNVLPLGIRMGQQTRLGVLYNVSNAGGQFDMTLEFSDSSTVVLQLVAPDWFGDQDPPAPGNGVEQQAQLGTFDGTAGTDAARPDVPLNVVEAIIGAADLAADGIITYGKRLRTISFGNRTNPNAGFAVFAAAARDPACPSDFDDGTFTGTPDGGVTIDDLLYYLFLFEQGLVQADVDDGSGNGIPDGGVTIDDLLYYLARFELGC